MIRDGPINSIWIAISFCLLLKNTICHTLDCSVVIDAGSTGTRLFVYGWNDPKQIQLLGQTSNVSPITDIHDIIEAYHLFNDLIHFAKDVTYIHCNESCPIYVKATAGMRLLTVAEQQNILSLIGELMTNQSFNPFLFEKPYGSIISGQKEGLFEWISINYMNGIFNENIYNNNLGVVTSGGASIQLSFMYFDENDTNPNHFIEYDNMKIYSQSYLGLGHKEMNNKVIQLCYNKAILNNKTKIENPCLFNGFTTKYYISKKDEWIQQFGTGKPHECRNTIKQIFHLNGINIYQPKFGQHRIFHATQFLSKLIKDLNLTKNADLYNISYIAFNSCIKKFSQFNYNQKPDQCFNAIYSLYLLSDILKFPEINTPIIFTANINYSWTLGFILYNMNMKETETSKYKITERTFISKYGVIDDLKFVNQYELQLNFTTSTSNYSITKKMKEYKSLQMTDRINQIYQRTAFYDANHIYKNLTNYDVLLALHSNNISPFIQGGMIRDLLLGIDPNDMDLVVRCNTSKLNETVNKLGWPHSLRPFLLFIRPEITTDIGVDIAIDMGQSQRIIGNEYDVNDVRWNYENQTLLITDIAMHDIRNRIISVKSHGSLFPEWCYHNTFDIVSENKIICLWKILRAWKLRIGPKFFRWDYDLWHWIKSTIITDFVYQSNKTSAKIYNDCMIEFFNNSHWITRSPMILYQMKLDLGEKLFSMLIPETVIKSYKHNIDQLETNDPYQWVMKCNDELSICDIEIVETKACQDIDHDPSKINGLKLNHFILICVGSFIIGIIFMVILMYSHACCSCCKKNEYEAVNITENDESDLEMTDLIEPELEVTNMHIYILFLNTFATYSLHRFIGRYSIYFAETFGITFLEVGYLQIALYLGHIISVFFPSILQSNFISTHLSYKILFFSFKFGLGLSTLAYIIYHPFWFLFVTRFLFGLTRCLYCVYRTTFIAINEKKINKQLWIFSFFSLHKPIGLLLLSTFGVILVQLSFQSALFLLVLPCLLLSFLFLMYFPNNTIKIDENTVSNNDITIQQNNSINISISSINSILSNEQICGNLGQIGLILGVLFGGILLEMFNICLSAWYHHTFNLNASDFWIVVVVGAFSQIVTFFLLTNVSKICKYYNPNNNGAILYFMACSIEFGILLFLYLFIKYNEIYFVLSLICVGIFNVASCAAAVAGNLLSVNLVSNKQDKSKLNAGMKSAHALGMLIGSFLGPFLFTISNFETVMLVANIAGFGAVIASGIIIVHNYGANINRVIE